MSDRLVDRLVSLRAAAALTVVGAVAGIIVGDVPGVVIACVLIGTAGVLVVSNLFLRVGLAEDRAREAEAAERAGRPAPERPERPKRGRPPRRRGH
jgi:hypothetical protein